VLAVQEDDGVDVARAVVDDDGVVDAVVRVTVEVADLVLLVRVVGGVAENFADESVDVVGLLDEVTGAVVLVEDLKEGEVSTCGVVVVLGLAKGLNLVAAALAAAIALVVAVALVVAIPGADVDGDPRSADVGVVEVFVVDVDAVVAPETEEVSPAVVGDPDGHIIVEVHDACGPGVVVEDCKSSGGCAIVDV